MFNVGFNTDGFLSIGPQDYTVGSNAEFNSTLVPGGITATGQSVGLIGEEVITRGNLSLVGSDFGFVIQNSARQLVTVTDVSKFGSEITLFDSLSLVSPAVGDIWWVPTTSSDGGTFTLNGDGTFSVGTPTSGSDTLVGVQYYDVSTGLWHGPVTLSIIDAPNLLVVTPNIPLSIVGVQSFKTKELAITQGELTVTGQSVGLPLSVDNGELTIAGQDITWRSDAIVLGELIASGSEVSKRKKLFANLNNTVIQGQDIILFQGSKLQVQPGTLLAAGKTVRRHSVYRPITIGSGVFAGLDISRVFVEDITDQIDLFTLTSITDAMPGSYNNTASAVLTGNGEYSVISITGDSSAEFRINNGPWRSTSGLVKSGDTLYVRMDAPSGYNQTRSCNILVADHVVPYTVSTVSGLTLAYQNRNLEVA